MPDEQFGDIARAIASPSEIAEDAWHAAHRAWYGPGLENTRHGEPWRWPATRGHWKAADHAAAWREAAAAANAAAAAFDADPRELEGDFMTDRVAAVVRALSSVQNAGHDRERALQEKIDAAWSALGTTAVAAADDPDTAELADSIRVSLQYERDHGGQAIEALRTAEQAVREVSGEHEQARRTLKGLLDACAKAFRWQRCVPSQVEKELLRLRRMAAETDSLALEVEHAKPVMEAAILLVKGRRSWDDVEAGVPAIADTEAAKAAAADLAARLDVAVRRYFAERSARCTHCGAPTRLSAEGAQQGDYVERPAAAPSATEEKKVYVHGLGEVPESEAKITSIADTLHLQLGYEISRASRYKVLRAAVAEAYGEGRRLAANRTEDELYMAHGALVQHSEAVRGEPLDKAIGRLCRELAEHRAVEAREEPVRDALEAAGCPAYERVDTRDAVEIPAAERIRRLAAARHGELLAARALIEALPKCQDCARLVTKRSSQRCNVYCDEHVPEPYGATGGQRVYWTDSAEAVAIRVYEAAKAGA